MSFFLTLIEETDQQRRELESVPRMHEMVNRGLSLPESARWGVAAAADNVSQLDPADLAAPRVRALFDQVRVEPSSPGNEPAA